MRIKYPQKSPFMYNLFETKWRHAAEVQKEDDESIQVKGDNWMQTHQDQRIRHSFIVFILFFS